MDSVVQLGLLTFDSIESPLIACGVSTRFGGVSEGPYSSLNLGSSVGDQPNHVTENRARYARALGFEPDAFVSTRQVHRADVLVVNRCTAPGALDVNADILLTTVPGYLLVQRFADCVPLLLWDTSARAVAVAHAGWRGSALGVAKRTVLAMRDYADIDPDSLRAAIGPSIGPCCFEVGNEVVAQFPNVGSAVRAGPTGRPHLDLWELNRRDLVDMGVRPAHIETAKICTRCHSDRFFSHRAHGYPSGRFGAAIGIRTHE